MKRVQVNTARPYSVLIGSGAIAALPSELNHLTKARRLMIVSDTTVAPLHLERVKELLSDREVHTHVFPAGEEHKSMDSLLPLLTQLLEAGFEPVTVSELFGYDLPETSDEPFVYDPATYRYPEKLKDAKEEPAV